MRGVLFAACAGVLASLAQAARADDTMERLLEETKNVRALEAQANAAREQEFLASRDRQKELLEQARLERDAAQKRSQDLSGRFDAHEIQLNELETLLKAREGNLGELFGVTRQVAGDLASVVYNSLISVQHPGRDEFFAGIARAKALPSIQDLERLWFEILREMTETGRVVRFDSQVVTAHGGREDAEVVRIGVFTALSNGRYLSFQPGANTLTVMPRQPGSDLLELARGVQEAREGYVRSVVDPSRGVLLSLTVQRPNVWERIEKGEAVGYVIIAVGLVGALCALYQFVYLVPCASPSGASSPGSTSPPPTTPSAACWPVSRATPRGSRRTARWCSSASRRRCCASCLHWSDSRTSCAWQSRLARCSA
jgi:biopolymer transport protein ExbB